LPAAMPAAAPVSLAAAAGAAASWTWFGSRVVQQQPQQQAPRIQGFRGGVAPPAAARSGLKLKLKLPAPSVAQLQKQQAGISSMRLSRGPLDCVSKQLPSWGVRKARSSSSSRVPRAAAGVLSSLLLLTGGAAVAADAEPRQHNWRGGRCAGSGVSGYPNITFNGSKTRPFTASVWMPGEGKAGSLLALVQQLLLQAALCTVRGNNMSSTVILCRCDAWQSLLG
jgi:hypothetical protein